MNDLQEEAMAGISGINGTSSNGATLSIAPPPGLKQAQFQALLMPGTPPAAQSPPASSIAPPAQARLIASSEFGMPRQGNPVVEATILLLGGIWSAGTLVIQRAGDAFDGIPRPSRNTPPQPTAGPGAQYFVSPAQTLLEQTRRQQATNRNNAPLPQPPEPPKPVPMADTRRDQPSRIGAARADLLDGNPRTLAAALQQTQAYNQTWNTELALAYYVRGKLGGAPRVEQIAPLLPAEARSLLRNLHQQGRLVQPVEDILLANGIGHRNQTGEHNLRERESRIYFAHLTPGQRLAARQAGVLTINGKRGTAFPHHDIAGLVGLVMAANGSGRGRVDLLLPRHYDIPGPHGSVLREQGMEVFTNLTPAEVRALLHSPRASLGGSADDILRLNGLSWQGLDNREALIRQRDRDAPAMSGDFQREVDDWARRYREHRRANPLQDEEAARRELLEQISSPGLRSFVEAAIRPAGEGLPGGTMPGSATKPANASATGPAADHGDDHGDVVKPPITNPEDIAGEVMFTPRSPPLSYRNNEDVHRNRQLPYPWLKDDVDDSVAEVSSLLTQAYEYTVLKHLRENDGSAEGLMNPQEWLDFNLAAHKLVTRRESGMPGRITPFYTLGNFILKTYNDDYANLPRVALARVLSDVVLSDPDLIAAYENYRRENIGGSRELPLEYSWPNPSRELKLREFHVWVDTFKQMAYFPDDMGVGEFALKMFPTRQQNPDTPAPSDQ